MQVPQKPKHETHSQDRQNQQKSPGTQVEDKRHNSPIPVEFSRLRKSVLPEPADRVSTENDRRGKGGVTNLENYALDTESHLSQ